MNRVAISTIHCKFEFYLPIKLANVFIHCNLKCKIINYTSSKDKDRPKKKEDGELHDDDSNNKRVPLSLEELLAKKKAEEAAQSKVQAMCHHELVHTCT